MTAQEHQAAAENEEKLSEEHAHQHHPEQTKEQTVCDFSGDATGTPVCWTDRVNPTDEHKAEAQHHAALAEKHRRASQALLDAEAPACGGLAEADKSMSPFAPRADIRSVKELHGVIPPQVPTAGGTQESDEVVGASIEVNAVEHAEAGTMTEVCVQEPVEVQ